MHTSTNPFTEWEVAVVKEAHMVVGNNWSAIARMLPGRTNAAVKNFWYAHKRRSQRARGRGQGSRRADSHQELQKAECSELGFDSAEDELTGTGHQDEECHMNEGMAVQPSAHDGLVYPYVDTATHGVTEVHGVALPACSKSDVHLLTQLHQHQCLEQKNICNALSGFPCAEASFMPTTQAFVFHHHQQHHTRYQQLPRKPHDAEAHLVEHGAS